MSLPRLQTNRYWELNARSRFSGTPEVLKPPTASVKLEGMSAIACCAVLKILATKVFRCAKEI